MILKFQDHEKNWSWISGVDELQQLGREPVDPVDYDVHEAELIGESDGTPPVYILIMSSGEPRVLALNCRQAYLCHDETGATIDIVFHR